MDLPVMDGGGTAPAYDYRLYDRIWQRVSPDLVPYPELRNGEDGQCPAAGGLAAPRREGGEAPGGALQHLLIQPQQGQLPDQLPLLRLR